MMPIAPPLDPSALIADPEQIRAAIDATDERARLLRRLLRLTMRFRLHLTTADHLIQAPQAKGGNRG